jgi:hypothetical protein
VLWQVVCCIVERTGNVSHVIDGASEKIDNVIRILEFLYLNLLFWLSCFLFNFVIF